MKKLSRLVIAAATVLTVAGVPMTAQAATCSITASNCLSQIENLNSLLDCYGIDGSNCITGIDSISDCINGITNCNIDLSQCGPLALFCR